MITSDQQMGDMATSEISKLLDSSPKQHSGMFVLADDRESTERS
jgi:hypothetical protein